MTIKRTFTLALLVVLCVMIFGIDFASAADSLANKDAILDKGGLADQTEKFKSVATIVLIIGVGLSAYVFYKKEK